MREEKARDIVDQGESSMRAWGYFDTCYVCSGALETKRTVLGLPILARCERTANTRRSTRSSSNAIEQTDVVVVASSISIRRPNAAFRLWLACNRVGFGSRPRTGPRPHSRRSRLTCMAASSDPPACARQIEGEAELVAELRRKTGPNADGRRLLHHVRATRGKIFWAVNNYFREVFLNTPAGLRLDFEAPHALLPPADTDARPAVSSGRDATQEGCSSSCGAPAASVATGGSSLEDCPAALLEVMLMHVDAWTVCQAAATCRAFRKVR